MTVREALGIADSVRAGDASEELRCIWLSNLEGRIRVLLHGETPYAQRPLDLALAETTVLAVPAPFDRVYWTYLVYMVDFTGAGAQVALSRALFEEAFSEYARYVQRSGVPQRSRA